MSTTLWDALVARLSRRDSSDKASTPTKAQTASVWRELNAAERATVIEYFGAARQLVSLFDSIRGRGIASDADEVMEAFKQAEFKFVWLGLRTVFPPSFRRIDSCEPEALERRGYLARVEGDECPLRYAPAMDRHLRKMRLQFHPRELDSHLENRPGFF